jgi:hypothetical protein
MRILIIYSGEYGLRHIDNIREHGPREWEIRIWKTQVTFPPVIDYPEDYLPEALPASELILSFAEHKGVAELLPDIAMMTGAKSVLVAVDNEIWLPTGLRRQLLNWLINIDVNCVTPKPLCSLTEYDYGITRKERITYEDPNITEFAKHFGKPELEIDVDLNSRRIKSAKVIRDAVCGCATYIADGIQGLHVDDVEEKAGLLHHHYPCLASMTKLHEFNHDTLMHESGNVLKDNINKQVKMYKTKSYITPGNRSQESAE